MSVDLGRVAPTQQRLWLLGQLNPESWIYNITSSIELVGELDVEALRAAAGELYERHEALRMTFRQVGSEVFQSLLDPDEPELELVDLADRQNPRELADRRVRALTETPMDLAEGPLFRMLLCRLGPRSHMLTLFVHHIVADAWSMGILWEELGQLYAGQRGAAVELEPVELSYREYAEEEWERARSPAAEEELGRWLERLEGVDTDNSLRTDRRRPPSPSHRGATVELDLPAELSRRVRERARTLRATPFMVMIAGFAATLGLYDRRREVVIATQVAGRSDHRLARTVGFFINTLPLRFDLEAGETLADLVGQARELSLQAYATEHVTFEQLLGEVGSLGDRSMNPLTQVAFQLLNVPIPEVEFGDLRTRRWWDTGRGAKFDLGVMLVPGPRDGLRGLVTYAVELYDEATIRALWQGYVQVLEQIVAAPDEPLRGLRLLEGERLREVEAFSRGPAAEPGDAAALLERLASHVAKRGDAVALRTAAGDIGYGELWARAGRVASALAAAGVGAEDVVAISGATRAETIVAILGAWRAGATAFTIEAAYASERLLALAADLGVEVGVGSLEAAGAEAIEWLPLERAVAAAGAPPSAPPPRSAYVVTTSGTTGRPRAVAAAMAAFAGFVVREAAALDPDRVVLQVPPLGFDPGMRDAFTTLAAGAELLLAEGIDANPIDAIADALASGEADSVLAIVPSVLDGVVNELSARGAEVRLRDLHCCGEALPRALAARAARALGCVPSNDYGCSECTMVSVSGRQDPGDGETATMPLGQPLAGVEAWVLGGGGQVLPPGYCGEIHIGGPHLVSGYLGDEEASAERFVPHPHGPPGARLHRTGDRGFFDAGGTLHWAGRLDRQVKIRGVRVEVAEVEAALLDHAAVRDVAVVPFGEGPGTRLVAYAVVGDGVAAEELRRHLLGQLPRASVPSAFQLVEAIPRSRRGKVQADLLPEPAPPTSGAQAPLEGELEQAIGAIWAQVLGSEELGAEDDFFELGGDSLAALQMASRVSALVERQLSIADVFDHPTIRDLASHLASSPA